MSIWIIPLCELAILVVAIWVYSRDQKPSKEFQQMYLNVIMDNEYKVKGRFDRNDELEGYA